MSTPPLFSSPSTQEIGPVPAHEDGHTKEGSARSSEPPRVSPRVCPDCAGPLARTSGCVTCLTCGWSRCG